MARAKLAAIRAQSTAPVDDDLAAVELALADLGQGPRERLTLSALPEVDTTTLGGRLKKARIEAGLRQQDVGDSLGVHVQCVSNWENARSRPRR